MVGNQEQLSAPLQNHKVLRTTKVLKFKLAKTVKTLGNLTSEHFNRK